MWLLNEPAFVNNMEEQRKMKYAQTMESGLPSNYIKSLYVVKSNIKGLCIGILAVMPWMQIMQLDRHYR